MFEKYFKRVKVFLKDHTVGICKKQKIEFFETLNLTLLFFFASTHEFSLAVSCSGCYFLSLQYNGKLLLESNYNFWQDWIEIKVRSCIALLANISWEARMKRNTFILEVLRNCILMQVRRVGGPFTPLPSRDLRVRRCGWVTILSWCPSRQNDTW